MECILNPGTYVIVPRTNVQGFNSGDDVAPLLSGVALSKEMRKIVRDINMKANKKLAY